MKRFVISGAAAPAPAPEGGEAAAKPEEGAEVGFADAVDGLGVTAGMIRMLSGAFPADILH